MDLEQISDALEPRRDLMEGLRTVLESWPLYRRFHYAGDDGHYFSSEGEVFGVLPDEIVLPCRSCKAEQRWKRTRGGVGAEGRIYFKPQPHDAVYRCGNCDAREVYFAFYWYLTKDQGGLFQKVGQYPPLRYFAEIPRQVAERLSDSDLHLYRQAVGSRNANFGIGAVSYLRRAVENALDCILEPVDAGGKGAGALEHTVGLPETAGRPGRVVDKIERVSRLLPAKLNSEGHDRLADLRALFSDPQNTKTDEESIDVFDKCRVDFEYLLGNLSTEAAEDAAVHRDVGNQASKHTQTGRSEQ